MKAACSFCSVCSLVNANLDLGRVLHAIARSVVHVLGFKGSMVRLIDPKGEEMELVTHYGLSDEYLNKGPVLLEKSSLDREAMDGNVVIIEDVSKESHLVYPEAAEKEHIRSMIYLPMVVNNRVIAILRAYGDKAGAVPQDILANLVSLSYAGAIAIDNARVFAEMHTLNEIARTFAGTLDLRKAMDLIVEKAAKTLRVKAAVIRLYHEKTKHLEIAAAYGLSDQYLRKGPIEIEKSVIDRQVLRGEVVVVHDVRKDRRFLFPEDAKREGVASMASAPLIFKEKLIGVLRVYTALPYEFSREELEFLSAMANLAAIALENASMYQHLKTSYDSLIEDAFMWCDYSYGPRE
jgi:GAF domain-containing protein